MQHANDNDNKINGHKKRIKMMQTCHYRPTYRTGYVIQLSWSSGILDSRTHEVRKQGDDACRIACTIHDVIFNNKLGNFQKPGITKYVFDPS